MAESYASILLPGHLFFLRGKQHARRDTAGHARGLPVPAQGHQGKEQVQAQGKQHIMPCLQGIFLPSIAV